MNPPKSLRLLQAAIFFLLPAALPSCSSSLEPIQNTCKGVDCSGHGKCEIQGGKAVCVCDSGYYADGLECIEYVDPCEGIDCSGHGRCITRADQIVCDCDPGWIPDGLNCLKTCSSDSECDDGNQCTSDSCYQSTFCFHQNNWGDSCEDGDACTEGDMCSSDECVSGPLKDCSGTGSQCRADSTCDSAGLRGNCDIPGPPINEGLACDDGNSCTIDDACSEGNCVGILIDGDGDGIPPESCGGQDCDDSDPSVSGETEAFYRSIVCTNGIDDDCDGKSDAEEPECDIPGSVCDQNGWCQDNPFAVCDLKAIWGSGTNNIWVINDSVYNFDGRNWNHMLEMDTAASVIWGFSESDVWVAGSGHMRSNRPFWIRHWNGNSWEDPGLGELFMDFRATALWGTSSSDLWITGHDNGGENYIYHWNGTTWAQSYLFGLSTGEHKRFNAIQGSGPDDIWAVGVQNVHWNGNTWTPVDVGTDSQLNSVLTWNTDNAWTVGENGTILHWNGSEWINQNIGTINYTRIWGLTPDDMWICGNSNALQWNGSEWSEKPFSCNDVWGVSENDIFAAGGSIGHWDGQSFTTLPVAIMNEDLEDIYTGDDSNMWAVGNDVVLFRNGTTWIDLSGGLAGQNINAVWAASPDDAWVVGDEGHIAHWDGNTWNSIDSGSVSDLNSVWGSRGDSVWAVGCDGTILHWDGLAWMPEESGTVEALMEVHGSSDTNVWAAGDNNTVLRWDGQSWQDVEFTFDNCNPCHNETNATIQNVLVLSPDNIWLAAEVRLGESWYLSRWDGSQWSHTASTPISIRIGGVAPDNVWLFELRGAPMSDDGFPYFLNWNGSDWVEVSPFNALPERLVEDISVTEQGSVLAAGQDGIILTYRGCRTNEDCVDSNICTVNRICRGGLCVGGTPAIEGSSCDDGVFCNGADTCDSVGKCGVHAGDPCGNRSCHEGDDICL